MYENALKLQLWYALKNGIIKPAEVEGQLNLQGGPEPPFDVKMLKKQILKAYMLNSRPV